MDNPRIKLFERIHKIKKSYNFKAKIIDDTLEKATPFQQYLLQNQNWHQQKVDLDIKNLENPILIKSLAPQGYPNLSVKRPGSPSVLDNQPYLFNKEEVKSKSSERKMLSAGGRRLFDHDSPGIEYNNKASPRTFKEISQILTPLEENKKSSLYISHPVNFLPGKESFGFRKMVRKLKPPKNCNHPGRSNSIDHQTSEASKKGIALGLIEKIILQRKGQSNSYQVKGFGMNVLEGQKVIIKSYEEDIEFQNCKNQSLKNSSKTDFNDNNIFGFNSKANSFDKLSTRLPKCGSNKFFHSDGKNKDIDSYNTPQGSLRLHSFQNPNRSDSTPIKNPILNEELTGSNQNIASDILLGNAEDINLFEYKMRPVTVSNSKTHADRSCKRNNVNLHTRLRNHRVASEGNSNFLRHNKLADDDKDLKSMLEKSIEKQSFVRSRKLLEESLFCLMKKTNNVQLPV